MKTVNTLIVSLLLLVVYISRPRRRAGSGYMGIWVVPRLGGERDQCDAGGQRMAQGNSGRATADLCTRRAIREDYAMELPSLAPMMVQADHLRAMLQQINAMHPGEPIFIAAHSAGGVVARVVLIRGGVSEVKALITIASPTWEPPGRCRRWMQPTRLALLPGRELFQQRQLRAVKVRMGALLDLT